VRARDWVGDVVQVGLVKLRRASTLRVFRSQVLTAFEPRVSRVVGNAASSGLSRRGALFISRIAGGIYCSRARI
jgi:hypothetical protein